jgi:hypothetical protein
LGLPFEEPPWYFPSVGEHATLLEAQGLEVRFGMLFDRPTPLEGLDGLRNWQSMFGRWMLDRVPGERREEFLEAVESAARPKLFHAGGWFADYRRLRVVAVKMT